MKKFLSLIVSSAIGVSVLCAPADISAESAEELVILGDSISTGYGLDTSAEYNYGQICADYLGWGVDNHAVDGADTDDLYTLITTDSAVRDSISDAETIVVSIGGNDIMQYVSKGFMDYAASKGYLNDGYTADDIPEKPTIEDLNTMVKLTDENGTYTGDCLVKYMIDNKYEALSLISKISSNLRLDSGTYEGYIPNTIIPNIEKIKAEISSLNSDAQIIFQTVYQPLQFTEEYYTERFGTGGKYESMSSAFTLLRTNMVDIMNVLRDELLLIENISIADVYYEFTSVEDLTSTKANNNQGSANYFTDIQESDDNRDIHPNQKGHLAIAAAVLEQIGILHDTSDAYLLRQIYEGLEDKADYPAIPLETYELVAGEYVAVETTTTTTTTTTTATTTSTTTTVPPVVSYNLGDVNSDNVIDPVDATLVLQQYSIDSMNGTDILNDNQKLAANVNADSIIDPVDATWILRYYSYASMKGEGSIEDFIANN